MPSRVAEENKKLNDFEKESQLEILKSMPQRLVFETTNRCNLMCRMCGRSHRQFRGADMSLETFKRTGPFWETVYDVSLFGWGEPLLNPNLINFFDAISAYHPRVFILTNGMLLTDELAEKFVRGGLTYLNFSLDGATPETYNKIRQGADFNIVLSNLKKVVALKKKMKSNNPYLRMVFVGMRENIEEFPAFVELASELGMDEAKMVYMIAYGRSVKDQMLFHYKELTNRILDEAKERAENLGIRLNIPDKFDINNNAERRVERLKHKLCCRPWEELFVQCDGKIRLCMLSKDIMGDLNSESVFDIWNGEKFQSVRKWINSDSPKSTCAHCPQCREMNVNDTEAFLQVNTELPGTMDTVKC